MRIHVVVDISGVPNQMVLKLIQAKGIRAVAVITAKDTGEIGYTALARGMSMFLRANGIRVNNCGASSSLSPIALGEKHAPPDGRKDVGNTLEMGENAAPDNGKTVVAIYGTAEFVAGLKTRGIPAPDEETGVFCEFMQTVTVF